MNHRDIEIIIGAVVDRHARGAVPIQHFAYCADLDEELDGRNSSVRSANFARAVLDRICGNEPGTIIEGWPEEADYRHLWRIRMRITPTRFNRAEIDADYQALAGCPIQQRREMMELYHLFQQAMHEGRAK